MTFYIIIMGVYVTISTFFYFIMTSFPLFDFLCRNLDLSMIVLYSFLAALLPYR